MGELTERDKAILNMEGRDWRTAARKEDRVRIELDLSPTAYYQELNTLIDNEAAMAYSPMVVGRLRRLRD
jgi:hypothetical protein